MWTYKNEKNKIYNINTVFNECSCPQFLDVAMCKHLTMVCLMNEISIPGLEIKQKFSSRKAQRMGTPGKASSCLEISK